MQQDSDQAQRQKRRLRLLAQWRTVALLYAAIALGSVIGSVLRWLATIGLHTALDDSFPWGTLFVNVTGSFVIGFYAALTGPDGRLFVSARMRQFVMTGICGGYTTFSIFSLETLRLIQDAAWAAASANIGVSIVAWLAAVWAGDAAASRLNRSRRARTNATKEDHMQIPKDAQLLRVFIGENKQHGGRPLHEAIVLRAREMHIAGATVLRGGLGYGHSSRLHTAKILRLSDDLPLVIEIVDSEADIARFLPELDAMMAEGGLVTLEKVQVLQYGPNGKS